VVFKNEKGFGFSRYYENQRDEEKKSKKGDPCSISEKDL